MLCKQQGYCSCSRSKNEHFWVLTSEAGLTGFLPATENHEKLVATKLPSEADITRVISYHTQTKRTNLPLSIRNIINMADKLGLSDEGFLQSILIYL